MRSTLTRTGLVAGAVGALVVGAVAVGGPANAAGTGPAKDLPAKDAVVIGCAVAPDGSNTVVPPGAVRIAAPEGGKDVTGVVRVSESASGAEAAVPVPADAQVVYATADGDAPAVPAPGADGAPVESFEVTVDALPDCSAAR